MNLMLFIDHIARTLAESLLNSLWQGCVLAIVVFFILFVLRRLNATTRYLILCLALLILAFLPFIKIFSAIRNSNEILPESLNYQYGAIKHDPENKANSVSFDNLSIKEANNDFGKARSQTQIFHVSIWKKTIFTPIIGLLGLMIAFMIYRLLKSYLYTKSLRRNLLTFPTKHNQMFEDLLKLVNIKRKVSLYASSDVKMPMAIGLVNPIILIPYNLVDKLTEEQLKQVILHELAHIKRQDDWTNLLQKIIEAFYFWHPAIYWLGPRLNLEREIACDDWVITLSGMPKSYARCLTRLIELNITPSQQSTATGVAWNKKHITTRIKMMLENGRDTSSKSSGIAVLLAIGILILAFPVFTNLPVVALTEPSENAIAPYAQAKQTLLPNPIAKNQNNLVSSEVKDYKPKGNTEKQTSTTRIPKKRPYARLSESSRHRSKENPFEAGNLVSSDAISSANVADNSSESIHGEAKDMEVSKSKIALKSKNSSNFKPRNISGYYTSENTNRIDFSSLTQTLNRKKNYPKQTISGLLGNAGILQVESVSALVSPVSNEPKQSGLENINSLDKAKADAQILNDKSKFAYRNRVKTSVKTNNQSEVVILALPLSF